RQRQECTSRARIQLAVHSHILIINGLRHAQERLDKAPATQMVFEDALIHIIDCLIRKTGSDRLALTGGAALNAVANMRLLEKFDKAIIVVSSGERRRSFTYPLRAGRISFLITSS